MNCLYSFRTLNELKSHEKVCKSKDFCGILIPSEKDNILEFNQDKKLDTVPYIIYADIEFLIKKKKKNGSANNPEKSSVSKLGEHISCGYSMLTIRACNCIGNRILYIAGEIVWKSLVVV